MMLKLAAVMVGLWALGCNAREAMAISKDTYVARMASAVAVAWPSLAIKAGFESETGFYSSAQILVYDGGQAWLIDAAGYKEIDPAPVKALELPYSYGAFGKVTWQDRPAVYIGLGEDIPSEEIERVAGTSTVAPYLFLLATHEAFHFYGQKGWPINTDADNTRATLYPAQIPPRQYRNQLIRHLISASHDRPDAYGKARYWYKRWQAEYPDEVRKIRFTDISEGTAQYIETVAELMAEGYAQYSDSDVTARLSKINKTTEISIDQESYSLGILAGNLLDRQGTAWWRSVVEGSHPLDILLNQYVDISDASDSGLDQRIEKELERHNQELKPLIGTFVEQLDSPNTVQLLVPMASLAGNMNFRGQYEVANFPDEIFVGFSAQFTPARGSVNIVDITTTTTVVDVCNTQPAAFLVLPFPEGSLPAVADGRLQMKKDGIDIDVPYPVKSSDNEKLWCVQT